MVCHNVCNRTGSRRSGWVLSQVFILACLSPDKSLAQDCSLTNALPINNQNFSLIGEHVGCQFYLTEDVHLDGENHWTPPQSAFTGGLDGNGYRISGWEYHNDSNPAALFRLTDGAWFRNITLDNFNVTGSPATVLTVTATDTVVDSIRIDDGVSCTGSNGGHATGVLYKGLNSSISGVEWFGSVQGGHGNQGQPGGSASGIMHLAENTPVSDVLVHGTVRGGDGGASGESGRSQSGAGGSACGVMAMADSGSPVSNVLMAGDIRGGTEGSPWPGTYFQYGADSTRGGSAFGLIETAGENSIVSNVWVAGTVQGGSANPGGNGRAAGAGGNAFGVTGTTGEGSVFWNVLVTGYIRGGDGGNSSAPNFGAGGRGGNATGIIGPAKESVGLVNLLLTGRVREGAGGQGHFSRGGADGSAFAIAGSGDPMLANVRYDSTTTGIPGGDTTDILMIPDTYQNWTDWRTATGRYAFPEALDALYRELVYSGRTGSVDCTQYAYPALEVEAEALFQVYSDSRGHLYQLARQPATGRFLLIRYSVVAGKKPVRDISFGNCGVRSLPESLYLTPSSEIQAGNLHNESLYLAITGNGQNHLLALPPEGSPYPLLTTPADIQALLVADETVYYTGTQAGYFTAGQVSLSGGGPTPGPTSMPGPDLLPFYGYALALINDYLYIVGETEHHEWIGRLSSRIYSLFLLHEMKSYRIPFLAVGGWPYCFMMTGFT